MYVFENLHPQNKRVGDCVKRALTKATGENYNEISKQLNRIKRELGEKSYNSNKVWKEFIKRKGWQEMTFQAVKGESRENGNSFCRHFKNGTYVLRMAKHLTCCKNGVIYDTWNCSQKCVYKAWKVN